MDKLTLYTYFRSSAAYRVRIALNLKNISYHPEFVHLVKDGGQQHSSSYHSINPQELLPALHDESNEETFTQSFAILEYLEESQPEPAILPSYPNERAKVRAFAQSICCDIHPLNNLRVLSYLKKQLSITDSDKNAWYQHWITEGFKALEAILLSNNSNGKFCFGNQATMADICLIPQVYNAQRFNCPLDDFPLINKIYAHCLTLDAFKKASPEAQPDHE